MAASGCLDEERSEELGHGGVRKASFLDMIRPERIYCGEFDFASVRSGPGPNSGPSGLAKCLVERLASGGGAQSVVVNNKVVAAAASSRGLASSTAAAARRDDYDGDQEPAEFVAEQRRNHRYDRAASTDSVATSSGESCRSSSDSASSAPCSPESVISDSGGAEGLPDSVASLVTGELSDAAAPPPDSGFNLSRLLLPQQHREGETAAEARKRDLRLVDEVVAAATAAASATPSDPRPVVSPASPRPQSSATAAALSLSSASCLSSSSSSATSTATPSATAAAASVSVSTSSTAAECFLANGSASVVAPEVPLTSSVTSQVPSVSVSSSSGCSAATTVSHAVAFCVTGSTSSAAVCRQTSSAKCGGVPRPSSPTSSSHPGACAKSSRRKRRSSGDARKRDSPPVSDEDEVEDEDICRRREAEVESLLRHCVDLVAGRLDPQHVTSTSASSLRGYRRDHQSSTEPHHQCHHHHTETGSHQAASPRSRRHQDHQDHLHCASHNRERITHVGSTEESTVSSSSSREQQRSCHVQERLHTGHAHHQHQSHHHHHSQDQHQNHHLRPPSPSLPPSSPVCSSSSSSSSSSIPGDDDSQCLLDTQTTADDDTTEVAALSISTTADSSLAVTTTPTTVSFLSATSCSTTTATSTSVASSSSLLLGAAVAAPSPSCSSSSQSSSSSTATASVAAEDGLFACRWLECEMRLKSEDALGDHVRGAHVDTQTRDQGVYLCRWQGCKVFERRSCSRQWLERHVTLSHCGSRPFPCIVAGCGQRFGSQAALQRHVNAHFERSLNGSGPVPLGGTAGSSGSGTGVASGGSLLGSRGLGSKELANGDSPLKLLRLRKKLKCRRRAWATAKHADFFDAGVMEELKHRLADVSAPQSPAEPHSWNGSTVTFHGTVVARRKENTGKVKVLLHWVPENILPDSWESENQSAEKVVALSSLSADDLHSLNLWPRDLPTPSQGLSGSRRRKRK